MNIELKEISIRELTDGYEDNEENGVIGYSGKLEVYQKRKLRYSFCSIFTYQIDLSEKKAANTVYMSMRLNAARHIHKRCAAYKKKSQRTNSTFGFCRHKSQR